MFSAKIPASKQTGVMESFWMMMKQLESDAYDSLNQLDIITVEGFFRQWNDIMDDTAKPMWVIFAEKEGKNPTEFVQEKRDAKRGR